MLQNSFGADGFGNEEAERAILENWGIFLGFLVYTVFVIAENDDEGFGTHRITVFVVFNHEDTHGR